MELLSAMIMLFVTIPRDLTSALAKIGFTEIEKITLVIISKKMFF